MSAQGTNYLRFGVAITIIVLALGYLAYTGVEESASYYVTIAELRGMGEEAHTKRLRVAGHVEPGSIQRQGSRVDFVLIEQGQKLNVSYKGSEAPPDTFVDDSEALVEGEFGRDGVFHAKKLQAKCASKYEAMDKQGEKAGADAPAGKYSDRVYPSTPAKRGN
jgi:cytochrome c-type biogenesis protein CcmE